MEFVSANPTGPLHVGHARQAALGDALCRLYDAIGWDVTREFYYNDAGNQIENLAISVQARARGVGTDSPDWPADGYKGDYIVDIARDFQAGKTIQASDGEPVTATGNIDSLEDIRAFAVAYLRREQDLDLQAFGLKFDNYYLESSLYTSGRVEATVKALIAGGHTYEEGGALWLRTTELGTGDDKDRVMRKSEGGYTYFVPDVAYHKAKWERGFHRAVNIQGSDHHGTVARVRAGLQALEEGIPKDYPSYVLHKMVKVMRGGQEVKISKRAGSYVTMRDLIDWVGRDAVRYFLIQRRADTEFVFDVDLALSKSDENPVYYIQYAHARICSVINNAGMPAAEVAAADASLLTAPSEFALMQRLAEFPTWWRWPPRNWRRTTSLSGCATAPPTSTAGTTPSACWSTTPRSSWRACAWPRPRARCWPTAWRCWACPPPSGCNIGTWPPSANPPAGQAKAAAPCTGRWPVCSSA